MQNVQRSGCPVSSLQTLSDCLKQVWACVWSETERGAHPLTRTPAHWPCKRAVPTCTQETSHCLSAPLLRSFYLSFSLILSLSPPPCRTTENSSQWESGSATTREGCRSQQLVGCLPPSTDVYATSHNKLVWKPIHLMWDFPQSMYVFILNVTDHNTCVICYNANVWQPMILHYWKGTPGLRSLCLQWAVDDSGCADSSPKAPCLHKKSLENHSNCSVSQANGCVMRIIATSSPWKPFSRVRKGAHTIANEWVGLYSADHSLTCGGCPGPTPPPTAGLFAVVSSGFLRSPPRLFQQMMPPPYRELWFCFVSSDCVIKWKHVTAAKRPFFNPRSRRVSRRHCKFVTVTNMYRHLHHWGWGFEFHLYCCIWSLPVPWCLCGFPVSSQTRIACSYSSWWMNGWLNLLDSLCLHIHLFSDCNLAETDCWSLSLIAKLLKGRNLQILWKIVISLWCVSLFMLCVMSYISYH